MQGRLRIAIVGYGTAGQAAALFLHAQEHHIHVFEQASELGPIGAGFLLQPTGLGALAELGLLEQVLDLGQRIDRLYGSTPHGRGVMDMRYADYATECFGLGMTRGSLFAVLRDADANRSNITIGTRIDRIDGDGRYVIDSLGNDYGPFDIIVAADGAHSRLRQQVPELIVRESIYPWGALWCLLPGEQWPHLTELRQRYASAREMIGLLPVGRRVDRPGQWLTFYFSLPGSNVDRFDASAFAQMRDRVEVIWPEAAGLLAYLDGPAMLNRARYRDVVLRRSAQKNLIFIGDSAHAMSPQLGQGANMALLDAQALARALATASSVGEAFQRYDALRRTHLAIYQRLSRWLTPLQSEHDWLAKWRDACFGPLVRLPVARGQSLKILTGTKRNWLR